MITLQTENTRETFFTDKEHYLAFRQAWKDYINGDKANRYKLHVQHHLLYAVLRCQDLNNSFTPLVNLAKIANNSSLYPGFAIGKWELSVVVRYGNTADLLIPFGDTVTIDMIEMAYDAIKECTP